MAKHSDEAADRALISSMLPRDADGALRVNPAGQQAMAPKQMGEVPLERTLQKPQAYKPTKGAP